VGMGGQGEGQEGRSAEWFEVNTVNVQRDLGVRAHRSLKRQEQV